MGVPPPEERQRKDSHDKRDPRDPRLDDDSRDPRDFRENRDPRDPRDPWTPGDPREGYRGEPNRPVWMVVVLACIPLVPVVSSALIYQVINNEQQNAKIMANEIAIKTLTDNIFSLNTPLSAHVLKLEDRFDEGLRASHELSKRVDTMDASGTRALSVISSNQQRALSQIDRLGERLLMNDKLLAEMSVTIKTLQEELDRRANQAKPPAPNRRFNLQGDSRPVPR